MEETAFGFMRVGDLISLTLYLVVTLGLGLWAGIRTKTTEGYFLGGRKMPSWAVTLSMIGTAISSMTFLAYPGSAYDGNFSRIMGNLAFPIGALLAVFIFVQFYREAGYISAYTYFERRFGLWARLYICVLYVIGQVWRMGLVLYLLSMAVTSMHPELDLRLTILLIGVFVTVYTVLGGIEAVIWTDVFQTAVLILGGLLVVFVVFYRVDGGAATVLTMGVANGKFSLVGHEARSFFDFSLARDTVLVLWIGGVLGSTTEFALDQAKVQRYCATSTARGAKIATLAGALGCIPLWFLFMFIGTCLWVFYQIHPDRMPQEMLADEVFPFFILRELPVGLGGVVLAGVMAAAMSTIDSSMSAISTSATEDIYKRVLVPGREDTHYLKAAKTIGTISGVGMLVLALWLTLMRQETILEVLFVIASMLSAGVTGLFLIGFCTTRTNTYGAAIAVILSAMATFGMVYLEGKAMAWETHLNWRIEAAVKSGEVDSEQIRAQIQEQAASEGKQLKLADLNAREQSRIREILADKIRAELGDPPQHLGEAIGIHPFAMGIVTNLIVLLSGYFFSLFRPAQSLQQLGGLTWWTRNMPRMG